MGTAARRATPPEAIRAAIIEATIRLIGRVGVDGVTHRAVAQEAGVSLSSTTYHYASKDEIVSEALRRVAALEIERVARDAERLADGHPDVASIARALGDWLAEQLEGPGLLQVRAGYHLQLEAGKRPELREINHEWALAVQGLAERVLSAAGSPRPRTDARILVNAIDGLRLEAITAPHPGLRRRVGPLIERLLDALTAP
ncbi:MAG TPA: TetR family transcriptional regulator [Solirubrobacteraceae bacterium]|nr:TetR family transcriptional regulator [Solirubrobacteraceae bacterium]